MLNPLPLERLIGPNGEIRSFTDADISLFLVLEELRSRDAGACRLFLAALLVEMRPDDVLRFVPMSFILKWWPLVEGELERVEGRDEGEAEERRLLWAWLVATTREQFPRIFAGVPLLAALGRGTAGSAWGGLDRESRSAESMEEDARLLLALWRSQEPAALQALAGSRTDESLRAAAGAAKASDELFSALELAYRVSSLGDWNRGLERGLPLTEMAALGRAAESLSIQVLGLCIEECAEAEAEPRRD